MRHEELVKLVLEGSVWSKNRRGRPRLEYTEQIREDMGYVSYEELKRLAQDKGCIRPE